MRTATLLIGCTLAALAFAASAQAQIFHDDDGGWCLVCFHHYGDGDVNRPGATPDRPYWHGDDAVPLGLRWHDIEAARAEAAAADAAAAAAVVARRLPARRVHRAARYRVAGRPRGPVLVRKD